MKINTVGPLLLPKTPIRTIIDYNGNRIHFKEESKNPSGSIKDRVFNYGLAKMTERKLIRPGFTLTIASSGNAAISLAMIAGYYGCQVEVFLPSSTSEERRRIMDILGITTTYVDGGMSQAIAEAKKAARAADHRYVDQFFDPLFLGSHADTAAEIEEELKRVDYFITGVGSGVTIRALGTRLKAFYPELKIIAYEPEEAPSLSKKQYGPHGLEGVGPNFEPTNYDSSMVEAVFSVKKSEAYAQAVELYRSGYDYGITTAAALVVAEQLKVTEKDILIPNYDSLSKYIKVISDYVKKR